MSDVGLSELNGKILRRVSEEIFIPDLGALSHGVCMCVIHTFPLHSVACFVISTHTVISQFFRIGPISLSNLFFLAIQLSPQGFQLLEITLTLSHSMGALNWVEGGGEEGFVQSCAGVVVGVGEGELSAVRYHNGALKLPMRCSQQHRRSDLVSFSSDRSICALSSGPLSCSRSHRHYRLIAGIAGTQGQPGLSVMRSSVVITMYHRHSFPHQTEPSVGVSIFKPHLHSIGCTIIKALMKILNLRLDLVRPQHQDVWSIALCTFFLTLVPLYFIMW